MPEEQSWEEEATGAQDPFAELLADSNPFDPNRKNIIVISGTGCSLYCRCNLPLHA